MKEFELQSYVILAYLETHDEYCIGFISEEKDQQFLTSFLKQVAGIIVNAKLYGYMIIKIILECKAVSYELHDREVIFFNPFWNKNIAVKIQIDEGEK